MRGRLLSFMLGFAALAGAVLFAGCVVMASSPGLQEESATGASMESGVVGEAVVYTAAKEYRPLAWLHGGERFPAGAMLMVRDANGSRQLAAGFVTAADANVSFDGKSVLFAGKQHASDAWQAWELSLADGTLKQVTHGSEDVIRPLYLPANHIVYARKSGGRFVLEKMYRGDGTVTPLSYAPGNFVPTDVLQDGRVLFESSYPLGVGSTPEIYTVYSDGTGVEAYRCDHGPARFAGHQVSSGDIVFPSRRGLARFTSPRANQVAIDIAAGDYAGDVTETPTHEWLLAWRADAKQTYQIEKWNPSGGAPEPLLSQTGMNVIEPVVVAPRAVPNRHPSTLREWTYSNLLTLNAYTSKLSFKPGSIATVRLYTEDDAGRRKLLGSAPVESDGSLYVHVPGDVPLQFELLDGAGKTLRKEAGWMWARKSEQRVCVGCHAGPERAPDNEVPAVLLRSTVPADMTAPHAASGKGAN